MLIIALPCFNDHNYCGTKAYFYNYFLGKQDSYHHQKFSVDAGL